MDLQLADIERRILRYADLKSGNAYAENDKSPIEIAKERYDLQQALKKDGKGLCAMIPHLHSKEMQSTYCHIIADLIAVL